MDAPETASAMSVKKSPSGGAKLVTIKQPSATAVAEAEVKLRAEAYTKLALSAGVQAQARRGKFRIPEAQGEVEKRADRRT